MYDGHWGEGETEMLDTDEEWVMQEVELQYK